MELPLLVIMIVVSAGMIGYSLLSSRSKDQDAVMRRMSGKRAVDDLDQARRQAKKSAAAKMMERIAPLAVKPVMPRSDEEMTMLKVKLANAGFRRQNASTLFLASKTVLGLGIALLVFAVKSGSGDELSRVMGFSVFGGGLGFMLPNLWLAIAQAQRADAIRKGLPDSLDLMVISVEAGLGLDAALQRVGDEMGKVHPVLSEELHIVTMESQMGVPRGEALDNMALRTGTPEVKALVAIINQAEKFGTSVARALRNQADSLRIKRRLRAEEAAQKTTVKLMAPLILFIFPAIFVVLAGPAALKLIKTMKEM